MSTNDREIRVLNYILQHMHLILLANASKSYIEVWSVNNRSTKEELIKHLPNEITMHHFHVLPVVETWPTKGHKL
jgi:hypothetical protein